MTNRMTKQTLLQCVNALLKTGYNTQGRFMLCIYTINLFTVYILNQYCIFMVYNTLYVHCLCCVSILYVCSWYNCMYVHGTSCVSNSMNMLADLDLYWSQGQFTVITKEFKKWYQKPIFILDIFF